MSEILICDGKTNKSTVLNIKAEGYELSVDFVNKSGEYVRAFAESFTDFKNDGRLTKLLIDENIRITAMESCTSGLFASNITDYEGASAIFRGSYVTYSNEAKTAAGVPEMIIEEFGVYSPETALAMAGAAKRGFSADTAVGITGSFSNVDPENPDSVAGEIFIGTDSGTDYFSAAVVLTELDKSRGELKKLAADIAAGLVYAALKNRK